MPAVVKKRNWIVRNEKQGEMQESVEGRKPESPFKNTKSTSFTFIFPLYKAQQTSIILWSSKLFWNVLEKIGFWYFGHLYFGFAMVWGLKGEECDWAQHPFPRESLKTLWRNKGLNGNLLLSCWLAAAQLFLARDSNFRCALQINRDTEEQIGADRNSGCACIRFFQSPATISSLLGLSLPHPA